MKLTLIEKYRARRRRKKRVNAAKALDTVLREFVYLDEVSVYSLLASRQGALASEYTDIRSDSLRGELDSSLGVSSPVMKAGLSSKLETTQSQSSQVLRKSTVQAAFKELYEGEENKLAVKPIDGTSSLPRVTGWDDLQTSGDDARFDGWIVRPAELKRGKLVEFEVELRTDFVHRVASMITAFREMVEDSPEVLSMADHPEFKQVAEISRILDRFLIGLIPIRCRILDYRSVSVGGEELLIHNEILSQLVSDPVHEPQNVYLVGVIEERLFWKDVRRVLFSGSHFRVMCRVGLEGLRDSWNPVKLTDVLRDVAPDLAQKIDQFGQIALMLGANQETAVDSTVIQFRSALVSYGVALSADLGHPLGASDLEELPYLSQLSTEQCLDLGLRREAFEKMACHVSETAQVELDRTTAANLRVSSLLDAGLGLDGRPILATPVSPQPEAAATEGVFVDAEIVAIYW